MARAPQILPRPLLAAALLALAAGAHGAGPAPGAPATDEPVQRAGGSVTLDFANAEIDAVARTMATLTGRNVVVDPRVKGTMTLTSTTPVSPAQALRLFAAQLRTQGFALVESSGLVLVLPEAEAKLQSGAVSAGSVRAGGQIQTQIFRLTHENAHNLVPVLRPLISPNNTINVNPGTNALVITDYGDNLQRLARIIAALDVSNATGVEVVRLNHAVASDLAPLVARLLESGGGALAMPQAAPGQPGAVAASLAAAGGSGDGYRTTLLPEPRSNAIILRAANPARLALARTLIQQLDQPPSRGGESGGSGNIHVVYLKNADAAKLAVTLRAALAALPGQSATPGGIGGAAAASTVVTAQSGQGLSGMGQAGAGGGLASGPTINATGNNQPSTGGQIQADPSTNSLIISAPEPVYRELRAVIDKLDQRRAQVFVESLIAEVRADKAADFGIQWQALLGRRDGSNVGIIGTNYGEGGSNIVNLVGQFLNGTPTAQNLVRPPQGFNLGLAHRVNGLFTLGALANFLQSTGTGNVLSTPTLLTLDNEEAKIIVGQNVPFVTGSFTNTGASGGTSVNPFQTIERKDVGLTLRVRPQISENGTVKMVIYQETSSVVPSSVGAAQGLITNKRAIESSVLVDDGAIVVLGGLMEDQFTTNEDKVPGLGDIPVVGNLFKSRSRGITKTNLMVFLRPVVVRDAAASEQFSLDRYDLMRGAQMGNQPQPSSVLQINQAPVMPPVAPVRPDAWTRPAPPPPLINPASGEANYEGG
ncbi:type II secretion system secretin GspD [Ottowia sp.]|jgi:general secretion pathway protein D|uniref:type II secretion system secretin GspD n=1 Tax=Ottowia sp. TaxID=1898956 RepID=UPI0025F70FE2|nr:type II secretion system secretin GspD [Ottowia sp.]MBK6614203.1 type II secretion system secretin GspD [Ottowia sp.]MBK6745238.1 type II secretion system secretin GspD [Ottowia sp.]